MSWAWLKAGGLCVSVRVQPGARQQRVKGVKVDHQGSACLSVQVNAPPIDGKANKAVVKLLAKRWGLAQGRFSVIRGETARLKVIEIADGDRETLDKILGMEDIRTTAQRREEQI